MATFTDIECYNREVWNLQCIYGTIVNGYTWNLKLGSVSPELRRKLIIARNIFKCLNNYDTRDIGTGINKYNKITEQEIYNLVSKLKTFLH